MPLTQNQLLLLKLLLEHNDTEKVIAEYQQHLFETEKKQYESVLNDWLLENLEAKSHKDARAALPLLGDAIVAYGRSLGGRAKIIKKEEAA